MESVKYYIQPPFKILIYHRGILKPSESQALRAGRASAFAVFPREDLCVPSHSVHGAPSPSRVRAEKLLRKGHLDGPRGITLKTGEASDMSRFYWRCLAARTLGIVSIKFICFISEARVKGSKWLRSTPHISEFAILDFLLQGCWRSHETKQFVFLSFSINLCWQLPDRELLNCLYVAALSKFTENFFFFFAS